VSSASSVDLVRSTTTDTDADDRLARALPEVRGANARA
jgi:hypothetical protein